MGLRSTLTLRSPTLPNENIFGGLRKSWVAGVYFMGVRIQASGVRGQWNGWENSMKVRSCRDL